MPNDLVIHHVNPSLAFFHRLRLEIALTVKRHHAVRAFHVLHGDPIPAVGLLGRRLRYSLIAKMRRRFGAEHPLH